MAESVLRACEDPMRVIYGFLSCDDAAENFVGPDGDGSFHGIFLFGHYSPLVADFAASLWTLGLAPRVIVTGKGRDKIPTGFETEADHYASILEKRGVSPFSIIRERTSTNSKENVLRGVAMCHSLEFHPRSLLLCAMPPLLRRACATFRKQFPEIHVEPAPFGMYFDEWLTERRIRRLLGEFDRFSEYAERGDIVPVQVPDNVQEAVQRVRTILG